MEISQKVARRDGFWMCRKRNNILVFIVWVNVADARILLFQSCSFLQASFLVSICGLLFTLPLKIMICICTLNMLFSYDVCHNALLPMVFGKTEWEKKTWIYSWKKTWIYSCKLCEASSKIWILQDTSKKSPMELINEVPPIKVEARIAVCEGGNFPSFLWWNLSI